MLQFNDDINDRIRAQRLANELCDLALLLTDERAQAALYKAALQIRKDLAEPDALRKARIVQEILDATHFEDSATLTFLAKQTDIRRQELDEILKQLEADGFVICDRSRGAKGYIYRPTSRSHELISSE